MRNRRLLLPLLLLLLFCAALPASAAEVIKDLRTWVTVQPDSNLEVKEELYINVENITIKHGIKRSLPVYFKTKEGYSIRVGLEVTETLLDDQEVPCEVSDEGDYAIMKIGDGNIIIPDGLHKFTIKYVMTRQVGFFEDFDELYWNVVGTGFTWPILKASVTVALPPEAKNIPFKSVEWYAGAFGSKGGQELAKRTGPATVTTVAPLQPGEAFTVVYTWPKGYITPPPSPFGNTTAQQALGAVTLLLMLALTFITLRKASVLRHSAPAVMPLFYPPGDASPGFVRYMKTLEIDDISVTADILRLGVKGLLRITETQTTGFFGKKSSIFTIERTEKNTELTQDEQALLDSLFSESRNSVTLDEANGTVLSKAASGVKGTLEFLTDGLYQRGLKGYFTGLALYAATVIALWPFAGDASETVLLPLILGGVFSALVTFFTSRCRILSGGKRFFITLVNLLLMLFAGAVLAFGFAEDGANLTATLLYMLALAALAPVQPCSAGFTEEALKDRSEVLGLYLFITVAEKPRMELLNAPEETPELYERLLPYALAMGAAKTWADRFASVLAQADYKPDWYVGPTPWFYFGSGNTFSSFTKSFDSAITPAEKPTELPSSYSGSGGGGFSGGGGGGGGASGW